jgi:16S rRNA (uracil1498-N3)-methyltransferase
MRRFYIPASDTRGDVLVLTGGEAHHASGVLRVRPGDEVLVLNGQGTEFKCVVKACQREEVSLAINETRRVAPLPWEITLLQALPKGKLIEAIIQKGTELGVSRIVPLLSERVVSHPRESPKTDKWRAVAVEAIKQCGSAWLPRIDSPLTPAEFLKRGERFDLPLVASLHANARHAREHFIKFQNEHGRKPRSLCVWIGPEGDFTPEEIAMIEASGALPITLGQLVLRTETAAVFCLSILNYELSSPPPEERS